MNLLKFNDQQLADLQQSVANEAKRRAMLAVNGHDAATVIFGNELAKRAVTVAAAGNHSILFVGPKNSGKTMLRAMCLDLGIDESYEARTCPCGNYGDPFSACNCTAKQIGKVSGTLPATDITIEVCRPRERDVGLRGTTLNDMRDAISRMSHYTSETLDGSSANLLKAAVRELGLDLVAVARILHVGRTIANLDNSQRIEAQHVSESINYRAVSRRM